MYVSDFRFTWQSSPCSTLRRSLNLNLSFLSVRAFKKKPPHWAGLPSYSAPSEPRVIGTMMRDLPSNHRSSYLSLQLLGCSRTRCLRTAAYFSNSSSYEIKATCVRDYQAVPDSLSKYLARGPAFGAIQFCCQSGGTRLEWS